MCSGPVAMKLVNIRRTGSPHRQPLPKERERLMECGNGSPIMEPIPGRKGFSQKCTRIGMGSCGLGFTAAVCSDTQSTERYRKFPETRGCQEISSTAPLVE